MIPSLLASLTHRYLLLHSIQLALYLHFLSVAPAASATVTSGSPVRPASKYTGEEGKELTR